MCKTYFHVTCAQREGFLTELRSGGGVGANDLVDPFIAYCRLHSDRETARKKKRNYQALLAKHRLLFRQQRAAVRVEDAITNQRTLTKLFSQREKFLSGFKEFESPSG